jgi:CRISPR-associated endonuclease/helicase Cas3
MDYVIQNGSNIYDLLSHNTKGCSAYNSRKDKQGVKPPVLRQAVCSAADEFFVIDKGRTDIIVSYGENKQQRILDQYIKSESIDEKRGLLKKLGKYTVSLYQYQLDLLKNHGAVNETDYDGIVTLSGFYDSEYGVDLDGNHEFLNV